MRTTELVVRNIVFSALCIVFKISHLSLTLLENVKILELFKFGS